VDLSLYFAVRFDRDCRLGQWSLVAAGRLSDAVHMCTQVTHIQIPLFSVLMCTHVGRFYVAKQKT